MSPTSIGAVEIASAAFFSTHHESAAAALAGRERSFTAPAFELLVGRARRFTSLVTQLHVEVCGALRLDDKCPAVFATCHGEIETAEKLITDVRESSVVSSARFALSVHNTASGLYSVATGSTAPITTVTGANAIAAGWLEAALIALDEDRAVLLSIADEPVPPVFRGPTHVTGVAAAFLLRPASPTGCRAELAIVAATDADEPDPLHGLARIFQAHAAQPDHVATISVGRVRPGGTLQLRIGPEGATT
jgi:hypothetical protein